MDWYRVVRHGIYTAGVAVLLLVCSAGYVAYLLNGDAVRLRVEASLSRTLRRPVTMAHLRLSPWTGTTVADDFRVADDAAFSREPFVRAERVHIGLDMRELLLHRNIRIRSITLSQPVVHLLRDGAGRWNYASLAPTSSAAGPERRSPGASPVTIASIAVEQGRVLVQTVAADGTAVRRAFTVATLQVRDMGAGVASPFQLAAQLPGGGTVTASGVAGPWDSSGAAHLSVQAHLQASHVQLAPAGLVAADSPVSGDMRQAVADLRWTNGGLLVSRLDVDSTDLVLHPGGEQAVRTATDGATATVWRHLLERLEVEQAQLHADALEVRRANGVKLQLHSVKAVLRQWSPGRRATFLVSTAFAGGTVHADGGFRVTAPDGQPADLDAEVTTAHLHLAASGLLQESTPVDGVVDSTAHLRLAQNSVQVAGSYRLTSMRWVHGGQPLSMPLAGSVRLRQSLVQEGGAGTLEAMTVQMGGATLHATGTYGWGGSAPTLRLTVSGERMPIDALESALPSAGIVLPEGSRLQGGTLSLSLSLQGEVTHLETDGPIRLEGTRLAGFDLGSKLRGLASFTGGRIGSATANGTELRRLSLVLHSGAGTVVTDHLEAEIAGIGTATGAGTIGPGGTLDYRLVLKLNELIPGAGGPSGLANGLAGALPPAWAKRLQGAVRYLSQGPMKNGVPILVCGTARRPTVTPDLGALLPVERHR